MTSSIGSPTSRRVESRVGQQDAAKPRTDTSRDQQAEAAERRSGDRPKGDPQPKNSETTKLPLSQNVVSSARERMARETSNRFAQFKLQNTALKGGAAGAEEPAPSPNLDDVSSGKQVLRRSHRDGAAGGGVNPLQRMLNRNGATIAVDGVFGGETEGAVKAFQKAQGLPETGEVNQATLGALETADAQAMRADLEQAQLPQQTREDLLRRFGGAADPAEQRAFYDLATSPGFAGLAAPQQTQALETLAANPGNPAYAAIVSNVTSDPNFQALPAQTRQRALEQIAKHQDDLPAATTLQNLVTSPGFKELSADEQGRMLDYVGANTDFIAPDARGALDQLLASQAYQNASPADQATQLQTFMRDQPGLRHLVTYPPGHLNGSRGQYTISKPTTVPNHQFRGSQEDALRYEVTVNGRTVPVYLPANQNAQNGHFHTIDEIAKGLAAMPPAALREVNGVTINPVQNPDDAYWAQQYNDPNFRSYMTAGAGGQITVYPTTHPISQTDLDSSMMHEVGHFVAHAQYGGDETQPSWDAYRAAIAADGIDVSGYGQYNEDEDFAETFKLYMGVRGTPQEAEVRAMYPNRFAIIDQILKSRAGTP